MANEHIGFSYCLGQTVVRRNEKPLLGLKGKCQSIIYYG